MEHWPWESVPFVPGYRDNKYPVYKYFEISGNEGKQADGDCNLKLDTEWYIKSPQVHFSYN